MGFPAQRPMHAVQQARLTGLVASCTGQATLLGPPAVAVHDQCHVTRDLVGGQRGAVAPLE